MKKLLIFIILGILLVGTLGFLFANTPTETRKDFYGNEVNIDEPYVWNTNQNGEIIKNPDGTYTISLGREKFIDDKTQRFPHYVAWNENFSKIINRSDGWFENDKTYISDFNFSVNPDPTQGQVVKFESKGIEINFQPMALNYRNDLSQIQQISMPKNNGFDIKDNQFIYNNVYGNGLNLTYTSIQYGLKENLVINQFSDLPTPSQYIIDGQNPTLDLDFIFSTNAGKIKINGVEWDKKNTATTKGSVQITDENGNEIYKLPSPIIKDSAGNETIGTYEFKTSGKSLYIILKTNYSWLKDAVYPVYIDPTIELNTPDTEVLEDSYISSSNPNTNYGSGGIGGLKIGFYDTGDAYALLKFNLNALPKSNIYSIDSSNVSIYASSINNGHNVTLNVFNVSDGWTEDTVTWNNQPSVIGLINTTYTGLNSGSFSPGYKPLNINTDLIELERDNLSLMINYSLNLEDGNYSNWDGKEGVNSPKLVITYTPYIDILSPTPLEIFTEDSPTAELNISTEVAMDVCYWNNGTTNYTMSGVNSTYWYNNTAGEILLDGTHSVTFLCNQSSDGTWRSSDSVNFDVDSVNITTCRDLKVSRTYYLQNNITECTRGQDFFEVLNSSVIIDGNYNYINFSNLQYQDTIFDLNEENIKIQNLNIIIGDFSDWSPTLFKGTSGSCSDFILQNLDIEMNFSSSDIYSVFDLNCEGKNEIRNMTLDSRIDTNSYREFQIVNFGSSNGTLSIIDSLINLTLKNSSQDNFWGWLVYGEIYGSGLINISDSTLSMPNTAYSGSGVISIESDDIYGYNLVPFSYITNVTYSNYTQEHLKTDAGTNSPLLYRKWYASIQVNDTSGNPIENANVTIYDKDDSVIYSVLTNLNGEIPKQIIEEYSHNTTGYFYSTPHTINVSLEGYNSNSTIYNLSETKNLDETIILEDAGNPLIDFTTGTEDNNSNVSQDYVYVNVSIVEANFENLTIYLYNESEIINESITFTNSTRDYNFTNLTEGIYYYNATSFDSLNQSNSTETRKITLDTTDPSIIINTITTTTGSQTVSFNTTISDTNLDSCWYSVYNLAGTIDGTKENVSFNCVNDSFSVSSYASYTLYVYANDSASNENLETLGFTVSASSVETGGGGGTTVVFSGEAGWTMETTPGQASYDISMPKGTSRTLSINFQNIGDSSRQISLSCVDITGLSCSRVTFDEQSFTLPLIKDIKTTKTFTVTIEDDLIDGDYQFNIRATDDLDRNADVSVILRIGTLNPLLEVVSKLGLKTKGGIPYILILLLSIIILFPLTLKLINEKTPLRGLWVALIGLGIPFFLVYIF